MIDWKLKLASVIALLFVVCLITHFVKKNKITVRYAIIWYLALAVLMVFSVFPEVLGWLTSLVGFEISSNFFICISLTIIVSEQKEQIRKLIQEVSLLKVDKNEK